MQYLFACGKKVVGDDPSVAPPPNRFGAHDYTSLLTASFPEPRQADGKGYRQRIVCIVLKAAHSPIGIGRGFRVVRLPPAAAKFGDMLVADLPRLQRFREGLLIELRIGARPRYRPYVDNEADARFS